MDSKFEHIQSAHCENGVVVKLLKSRGITQINEPMAFGIGSGLFYVHIPFLKLNNAPALSFRTMPGGFSSRPAIFWILIILRGASAGLKRPQLIWTVCWKRV